MRIAVSGTHCSGKSTLIEDFVAAHADYVHEPEPYEWLQETYAEPSIDDFQRQLELSVERLQSHARGAKVIAERSPLDFLAYMLALTGLGRVGRDCEWLGAAAELAAAGMANVDLLVVLPLRGIVAPEDEDPELREAMNEQLLDLIATDPYSLLGTTRVVEIDGTPEARLRMLERAMR